MITITRSHALLLAALLGIAASALAKGEADMRFHGTLITPPPCTLNDGNRIDVDFGDRLGVNKVDGVNYRQVMNYQLTCEKDDTGAWAMMLSLDGPPVGFDEYALPTSKNNLGIRLYQNDTPFAPGSALKIDPGNPPRLEAVPVKKSGSTLTKGDFDAWATLRANYQ